jgi:conjugal transfer pilus assembly protein TraE
MSRRIITLATTYSPPTARAQFEDLLYYFAPESYPDASKLWYSLAGRIEESQVSSVFYLEKIKLIDNMIEIFGNLKQLAGDTLLENTSKTYLLNYRLQDGRFYVVSLKEKTAGNRIMEGKQGE